jgi:hypothetical protein
MKGPSSGVAQGVRSVRVRALIVGVGVMAVVRFSVRLRRLEGAVRVWVVWVVGSMASVVGGVMCVLEVMAKGVR